jgi:hypothetical protein
MGQARPSIGGILRNYSATDVLEWGESVSRNCKMALSVGWMGHEVPFVGTIQTKHFPQDGSESGVYQLVLFGLRQRSQKQELPLGTPESVQGLEAKNWPLTRAGTRMA